MHVANAWAWWAWGLQKSYSWIPQAIYKVAIICYPLFVIVFCFMAVDRQLLELVLQKFAKAGRKSEHKLPLNGLISSTHYIDNNTDNFSSIPIPIETPNSYSHLLVWVFFLMQCINVCLCHLWIKDKDSLFPFFIIMTSLLLLQQVNIVERLARAPLDCYVVDLFEIVLPFLSMSIQTSSRYLEYDPVHWLSNLVLIVSYISAVVALHSLALILYFTSLIKSVCCQTIYNDTMIQYSCN